MWHHMKHGFPWSQETDIWKTCKLHVSNSWVGSARRVTFTWNLLLTWGWHLDPQNKWRGHCILWNCDCNHCSGWRHVGQENVMGDNMLVLHNKFCRIIFLGIVSKPSCMMGECDFQYRLHHKSSRWCRGHKTTCLKTRLDNKIPQYGCHRWHVLVLSWMPT